MHVDEYITIHHHTKSAHSRANKLLRLFSSDLRDVDPYTVEIRFRHETYIPDVWNAVQSAFSASGIKGSTNHYVDLCYEEREWNEAPLWEVEVPGDRIANKCREYARCHSCNINILVPSVPIPINKPLHDAGNFFSFSTGVHVVSTRGKKVIDSELQSGLEYRKFDAEGRYFSIQPVNILRSQIISENECEEPRTICTECGRYQGRIFGPIRFTREEWLEFDFVELVGRRTFLYCSPRAFWVLKNLNPEISRVGLVLLE